MDKTKLAKLRDLAETLDAKRSGTESIVLLKKINELKAELVKLQELLGVVENNATSKTEGVLNTLNETYTTLESKIEKLYNNDLSLSKDSEYSKNYFKDEIKTLKNIISNLKLQKGTDGRNPLTTSKTPPVNPQKGDLWYKD